MIILFIFNGWLITLAVLHSNWTAEPRKGGEDNSAWPIREQWQSQSQKSQPGPIVKGKRRGQRPELKRKSKGKKKEKKKKSGGAASAAHGPRALVILADGGSTTAPVDTFALAADIVPINKNRTKDTPHSWKHYRCCPPLFIHSLPLFMINYRLFKKNHY